MEHVRMKVNGVNIESSEDLSIPFCTECIANNDTKLCQVITDAHELITDNSTCRNKEGKPIIWNKDN
jgi:hypothetical protein